MSRYRGTDPGVRYPDPEPNWIQWTLAFLIKHFAAVQKKAEERVEIIRGGEESDKKQIIHEVQSIALKS